MCSHELIEANAEQARDIAALTASKETFKAAAVALMELGDEYAMRIAGYWSWGSFDRLDWKNRWCAATSPLRHLKEGSKAYWRYRALDAELQLEQLRKGEFPRNA